LGLWLWRWLRFRLWLGLLLLLVGNHQGQAANFGGGLLSGFGFPLSCCL
jgi:hypothetical protein